MMPIDAKYSEYSEYSSIEEAYERLELECFNLRRENAALRQMIPLLKSRLDAFLVWFQGTVNSIH